MDKLNVILDKVITYTDPILPAGEVTFAEHKSLCYPKTEISGKSVEEMLKKALEYAYQGMDDYDDYMDYEDGYIEGKYYAYEDMAAHLKMLIKEAK